MVMRPSNVLGMVRESFPSFLEQRKNVQRIRSWQRGEPPAGEGVYRPKNQDVNEEYKELEEVAPTPWLDLVVGSSAQAIFLEGVRRPGVDGNLSSWDVWQENGWDAKQAPLYRAALGDGIAYGTALPARSRIGGGKTARLKARSALTFAAFYDDDDDEFPSWGMHSVPYAVRGNNGTVERGWNVVVIDDEVVHSISCKGNGEEPRDWTYISYEEHFLDVPPIVAYTNLIDLEGKARGEVEPLIPLARRIDQDTFDRLIVQRFGAWKVRFISGMAKPTTEEAARLQAMRLQIQDILISTNHETKFGTLDETQIDGFIKARDADIRDFAAISQTPPHYLLGSLVNLSAEALAAAEASLMRKIAERQVSFGESHERLFRLAAHIRGDQAEARAYDMEVRWRDMESRSLAQAADALGKLVTMVGVPPEMAMEKIPNWTDTDVARAVEKMKSGAVDQLLDDLQRQSLTAPAGVPGRQPGQA